MHTKYKTTTIKSITRANLKRDYNLIENCETYVVIRLYCTLSN